MNRKLIISLMVIPLLFGGFAYAETKTLLGDLRIYNPDPTIFLSPPTTGETKAWIGIREDAGGDNNDSIMFGIGNDKASGEIVEIDKDGNMTSTTIDTGQGANEVYAMDQDLETTDTPEFVGVTLSGVSASLPVFTDGSKGLITSGTVPIDRGGTGQTTAAEAFGALKQDATDEATGVVEFSTDAEIVTGSATDKATTPANIAAKLAAPGAIGGTTPSTAVFTTIDTGQGANEVYAMDQDLETTDTPEFVGVTLSGVSASLPVFTDGSKGLITQTTAQAQAALGVYAGSGTFNSTTGVAISIGATLTGTTYMVTITPTADPLNVGSIYVVSKATDGYTVKCTGSDTSCTFDWILIDKN